MTDQVTQSMIPGNPTWVQVAQVYATLSLAYMTYASTLGFSQGKEQWKQVGDRWQKMALAALKQAGIDD